MKISYSERDYTFGRKMLTLRDKIGMKQEKLGEVLGVSGRTVSGWETGNNYPKTEHLKAFIALAVQHQAFAEGSEAEEIRTLWKVARQRVLLDEHWLSTLLQEQARELHIAPAPVPETTNHMLATTPSASGTREKSTDAPAVLLLHEHEDAKAPQTTRPHKRLVGILITLVIVLITGAGGTLFLQVRAHRDEQAQKITPTQTHHPYPAYLEGSGTLVFFDPLSQDDGGKWALYSTSSTGGPCQFTGGAYHVSQQPNGYFAWCLAQGIYSNFAFEVQLTITQGDCGGMMFRRDNAGNFYYFRICVDGTYMVAKYAGKSASDGTILFASSSSAIQTGPGQQNLIALVASGSTMTFYVNEQRIYQEQDNSYAAGKIALIANPRYGNATDVAYSNAGLWRL
jgi:transcriptional regulator with XRE-family HTH domain